MYQFFVVIFIYSLEYIDIVLLEIKDMPETAFSAPFSFTLKGTTLSEQGLLLKKSTLSNFYMVES